jgi:hypothetical protein
MILVWLANALKNNISAAEIVSRMELRLSMDVKIGRAFPLSSDFLEWVDRIMLH